MRKSVWASLLALVLIGVLSLNVWAAPAFIDPSFQPTWSRVDKPVSDIPGVGRGYVWGPPAPGTPGSLTEPYNNGTRKVQYFDKARMEINNPAANPNDLYYVTTGLLVEEMVTGQLQLGDTQFETRAPATIQVAGDSNENGANAIAPTYASFKEVASVTPGQNSAASTPGAAITRRIFPGGRLADYTPASPALIGGYDSVTRHNIADVFRRYGEQTGLVWNGQRYVQDKVFFNNPTYVTGRPITEPYWVHAVVAGVEREVLVQLFERRVLTYTPSNSAAYQVEMGNVGQHYYRWRYVTSQKAPVLITSNLRGQFVGAADYLVWVEYDETARSIHAYNFRTKEQFVVKSGLKDDVLDLKADGNKIVWYEIPPVNHLVVYDLDARKQVDFLDAKNNPVSNIGLYKGVLYYSQNLGGQYGIYSYNLATSELRLVTDKVLGEAVVADGYVLWKEAIPSKDYPNPVKLHLYRLSDGNDQVLLDTKSIVDHFSIANGKIFWTDFQNSTTALYLYDISSGTRQKLADNPATTPFFSGDRLIWTAGKGGNPQTYAIVGYDLATGQIKTLLDNQGLVEAAPSANPQRLVYKRVDYGYHGEQLYALDLP